MSPPNRKSRRAAEARARRAKKRERTIACENTFYRDYIAHLPTVPIDAPLEPATVYHMVVAHDEACAFYDSNNLADCNCSPIVTRHVEPRRS